MIVKYLNRGIFLAGSIYKFDYSRYNIDPNPMIIYMSSYKINSRKGYFNNFIYGLNLNYLMNSQVRESVSFLNKHIKLNRLSDWNLFINKFQYLHGILRKYNVKYISNIRKIDSMRLIK